MNNIVYNMGERMVKDMSKYENDAFQIILHGGNARSSAFEALRFVKANSMNEGKLKMQEAKEELNLAQRVHAKLLQNAVRSGEMDVDFLVMHSEDHVASSQVVVELVSEMIEMYERFGETNE